MAMIKVAPIVPGGLAWGNFIMSLQVGAYCWLFYCFALLIAPLSIGEIERGRLERSDSNTKLSYFTKTPRSPPPQALS